MKPRLSAALAAISALCAVFSTGCQTGSPSMRGSFSKTDFPHVASVAPGKVFYRLEYERGSVDSESLAMRVWAQVRSAIDDPLLQRVDRREPADLRVLLNVSRKLSSRTDKGFVYEGFVRGSFTLMAQHDRLISEVHFNAMGERYEDPKDAETSAFKLLKPRVLEWAETKITAEQASVCAEEITIKARSGTPSAESQAKYERLRKFLVNQPGVHGVRVLSEDKASGKIVFRVLYERKRCPQGVLASILDRKPDLEIYLPSRK